MRVWWCEESWFVKPENGGRHRSKEPSPTQNERLEENVPGQEDSKKRILFGSEDPCSCERRSGGRKKSLRSKIQIPIYSCQSPDLHLCRGIEESYFRRRIGAVCVPIVIYMVSPLLNYR